MTARRYGASPGVLAIAHRGGPALGPENTAEAFERSVALGFRYLETDVRTTSDGVCVAFHDRTLSRVTGRRGRIADLSWDDVRRLRVDGQAAVPRLDDLLAAWPEARWVLDVKQPSALGALVRVVRRARATGRVCLSGARDRWLDEAEQALGPAVSTALGWDALARVVAGAGPVRRSAQYLHVPLGFAGVPVASGRLIERAHARGLRVVVWGVDASGDARRLLDEGVDGLITNRPDMVREVLVARGAWPVPWLDGRQHPADPRPPARARPRTPEGSGASSR